jgi:hypothetical protein
MTHGTDAQQSTVTSSGSAGQNDVTQPQSHAVPHTTGRFAVWRQLDRLLGGKVDTQLPSGKPRHGARRYNRMAARGKVFMPGLGRRVTR